MNQPHEIPEFSLHGGLLYRLGCRLGLVRAGWNSIPLGLVLGGLSWVVLIALAIGEGQTGRIFSLTVIGAHVRLLLVIPLLILGEVWVDLRMRAFVRLLVTSEIVPRAELPALKSVIDGITRWRDSWLPEGLCLLLALLLSSVSLSGVSANFDPTRAFGQMRLTGAWYLFICLPLFRFVLLRCLSRLLLWTFFLRRLAQLDLHLVPTHPDGVAGLGYLEVVHAEFSPLLFAFSAVVSASFAEQMTTGETSLSAFYPILATVIAVDALLFIGPLCLLSQRLWACKVKGWADYANLGSRYVGDFERKWLHRKLVDAEGDVLLGTSDIQSLADLNNSVSVVRNMRLIPLSPRLLMTLAVAVALPLLPLLLLIYPIDELLMGLCKRLVGL
jgi:hypothetical protein